MKMNKKILIFADYYLPGYKAGGPIKSINSICRSLCSDFDIYVVTRDRDQGDSISYTDVKVNEWFDFENIKLMYVDEKKFSFFRIYKILQFVNPDVIHLNSVMSLRFSFFPYIVSKFLFLQQHKILISPRGELSEGAIQLKPLIKKIYIKFITILGYNKKPTFIASSDVEKEDIIKAFNTFNSFISPICRIDNFPNFIQWEKQKNRISVKSNTQLNLVFFSRVSPMKNLDYLLSILKLIKFNVKLDVFGPKENLDYFKTCCDIIQILPSNIDVNFLGPLKPDVVYSTLKEYDFFVLPSLGENFGQAIWESLASGLPVIISDRTPWRHLNNNGVGWDICLDEPMDFLKVLNDAYLMEDYEHALMRERCRNFAFNFVTNNYSLKQWKQLYIN